MNNGGQSGRTEGEPDIKESIVDRSVRIGNLLKEAREQRRKSLEEIADAMRITFGRLMLLEMGLSQFDMPPGDDILKSYAEALGDPDLYNEFSQKPDL